MSTVAKEIKRLEKNQKTRNPGMKLFKIGTSKKKTLDKENVSKQGRDESNKTEELNLSYKGSGETKVFDYNTIAEKNVNAVEPVSTAGVAVNTADEMTTMADTLMAIRSTRPRTTSAVILNVEEEPRRATPLPTVQSQDKEQAQFEREQRIAKEKAKEQEANDAALIEQMEDVQARMDADVLLSKRFQQEEREQFTINEQARMLVDLIVERKREQKWINDFVPMDSEVVNDSEQQAESSKKRSRVDHDKESVKK
uniref:Uncharacterized protein n=1 Tax=Tanacetum cinerariifolium TaxID=118510 RepID=A0A699HQ05_TANCI|nr:hypothetical protein [Tanacetum cinerariifolium]